MADLLFPYVAGLTAIAVVVSVTWGMIETWQR
jgi:hypothetical protein